MPQIRIFVGDSNRNGRLGMEMLIDNEPGFQVVGIAIHASGLSSQVKASRPDIVLLDWPLAESSPITLFTQIHTLEPKPIIVVMDVREETRQSALACGADAFFCKDVPADQLITILQQFKQ